MRQRFNGKFSDTPVPGRNVVRNLIDKFRKTGPVDDAKRFGRSTHISEEKTVGYFGQYITEFKKITNVSARAKYLSWYCS